jgi:hypothetical protein
MRHVRIAFFATLLLIGSAAIALAGDAPGSCRSAGTALAAVGADDAEFADFAERCVSLNQVQVLGSHNSYHIQPAPSLDLLLRLSDPPGPELSLVWEYTHVPLDEQFSFQGIRQIELDVFLDPAGGLYAVPLGNLLVAAAGLPPDPDHDPDGVLLQPGFKVLHVQDLGFRSTCLTLASCLDEIQQWSSEHPRHLPLLVLIELKDDPLPSDLPFVVPPLYQAEDLDDLDALIRSVFPSRQLVTPDDVRGKRKSLEEAVLNDGWPVLEESRGRVIFALDNGGEIRDLYVDGHPSLEGRVLFTDSSPGQPEAAFMKLHRANASRRGHAGSALRCHGSARRRARERRAVRQYGLPDPRSRLWNGLLRRDSRRCPRPLQSPERTSRLQELRARGPRIEVRS